LFAFQTTGNNKEENQKVEKEIKEANENFRENVIKGAPYENVSKDGEKITPIIRTSNDVILDKLENVSKSSSAVKEEGEQNREESVSKLEDTSSDKGEGDNVKKVELKNDVD
jgi:hypothetical protein